MKVKAKENRTNNEIKSGDVIKAIYDYRYEYYMVGETADDKYVLIALAVEKKQSCNDYIDEEWYSHGYLTIGNSVPANSEEFCTSINDLIGRLMLTKRCNQIIKVNTTLVEE